MFLKIFVNDKIVLEGILQFLNQRRVLLDYAPIFVEAGGFTQIIRVKCDDAALSTMLRPRFKKNFSIIK